MPPMNSIGTPGLLLTFDTPPSDPTPPTITPQTQPSDGGLPHIYGKLPAKWRLQRLRYIPDCPPYNPGLLALTRGGLGGMFCVRNALVKQGYYAMEILHIPSLISHQLQTVRTFKKLQVFQTLKKYPCRFVLQASSDIDRSVWWSDSLYLHIITVR
jgi:hypothetical protein